ncbi:transcription factor TGA7-like [Phragmites australis]|uniref:transcription factor TGA7-like n=1 Tax=Phragmites australis TaxID=29695 RepID=UPI002D79DECF|nr:transcription factor TGA7-like [Phragmites australis]XP_062195902.1 transcription factor TGA7-like [Phragmites australis]XP_062195903.1 transcription factor TGA7-like [Phragmites australis]
MTSASVGAPMGIYEPRRQLVAAGAWGEPFRPEAINAQATAAATVTGAATAMDAIETEVKLGSWAQDDAPVEEAAPSSDSFGHDDARPREKAQRRLVQNREAARKSRLRKKAYIQNLETSQMKLAQLEQELTGVRRQQGVYATGLAAPVDPGVAAFEMEYAHWVEEQSKQAAELRTALQAHAPEIQLRILVDAGLAHYDALFRAKSMAARSDAFFVLSGVWRTPAERFFLWIGGFRPSELLKILAPQLEPLAEQQASEVRALQQTARQLEDALSQGMDMLQQTLVEALMTVDSRDAAGGGYAAQQMASALGKLDGLAGFVEQADLLRQETLRNMHKILTARQAARGLLALGDYCQRLRALSSLWAARPREPA